MASGVGVVASDGGCDRAGLLLSSADDDTSTVLLAALALLLIRLFLQNDSEPLSV